jgi:hypothetical protein
MLLTVDEEDLRSVRSEFVKPGLRSVKPRQFHTRKLVDSLDRRLL